MFNILPSPEFNVEDDGQLPSVSCMTARLGGVDRATFKFGSSAAQQLHKSRPQLELQFPRLPFPGRQTNEHTDGGDDDYEDDD